MELKIVIEPFSLLWPQAFADKGVCQFRGQPGYIVDVDAPCEDVFLAAQEHKLRGLTVDEIDAYEAKFDRPVAPGKIELPMALAALAAEKNGVPFEPLEIAKKLEDNAAAAALNAEADALGIPDPEPAEGEWSNA